MAKAASVKATYAVLFNGKPRRGLSLLDTSLISSRYKRQYCRDQVAPAYRGPRDGQEISARWQTALTVKPALSSI
jgi:hypothetical protein